MILSLALILAATTPTETLARSMEDYTQCLREKAGSGPLERQAAAERARSAVAQCADRRAATILLAIEQLSPRIGAEEARERIEQALASVEALYPPILVAGVGVEIPNAIAPIVRRYSACLRDQMEGSGATRIFNPNTYRAAADAAIVSCASVRAEAIAESEAVLSMAPDYRDAAHRRAAIQHAFDGIDYQQRNLLEIVDVVRREREPDASN